MFLEGKHDKVVASYFEGVVKENEIKAYLVLDKGSQWSKLPEDIRELLQELGFLVRVDSVDSSNKRLNFSCTIESDPTSLL